MIGAKFKLKRDMLGAKAGDIGYVFDQYTDFDNPNEQGVQIIFPNGGYDGFSVKEQELFLEYLGIDMRYTAYEFRSVIQVSKDFMRGYWQW